MEPPASEIFQSMPPFALCSIGGKTTLTAEAALGLAASSLRLLENRSSSALARRTWSPKQRHSRHQRLHSGQLVLLCRLQPVLDLRRRGRGAACSVWHGGLKMMQTNKGWINWDPFEKPARLYLGGVCIPQCCPPVFITSRPPFGSPGESTAFAHPSINLCIH